MYMKQLVLGELDTNCYIIWSENGDGLILDPADEADIIIDFIKSKNITVKAVVLSHAHFDHMLAVGRICQHTGAPLYVGRGDETTISDPKRNLSVWVSLGSPIRYTADRLLSESDTITVGDISFEVLETPGHTPGCICLYSDGVLFSGDTLFFDSIGRLDFPGGDSFAMESSLMRLISLPEDTVVYPGHGPKTTIGREKKHNPYLR